MPSLFYMGGIGVIKLQYLPPPSADLEAHAVG